MPVNKMYVIVFDMKIHSPCKIRFRVYIVIIIFANVFLRTEQN